MIIAGLYSFNGGQQVFEDKFQTELGEIQTVIAQVNASKYQRKISKEKTMRGRKLFAPKLLNKGFHHEFVARGWKNVRINCEDLHQYYTSSYSPLRAKYRGRFVRWTS
jgi:hypothetical protein